MRRAGTAVVLALVAGLLGPATSALADPGSRPPPRTTASVEDPARDATGTDPDRRARADLRRVDYVMPLPRNQRVLTITHTVRRLAFHLAVGPAPAQQFKTLIDGPGDRDYAVTVYNGPRSPRVVSLAGDRPRRIEPAGGSWGGAGGRHRIFVSLSTEWLRAGDRADLSTTATSRRATDRVRTAPRLNVKYAGPGPYRPGAGEAPRTGTYDRPSCTTGAEGLDCSFGAL